ncbi:DUF3048 domain-containing protein [Sporosarcina sp. CAU 1771]
MKRILNVCGVVGLTFLLLAACSKEEQAESPEPLPPKVDIVEAGELAEEEQDEAFSEFTAPFTGLPIETEATQRPILATINNHPLARPQSGISDADIVYEFLAEGKVTRLLALYQSTLPEQNIGPIRSARDYFIFMAKGLDAFYVAHGYSPDALALLQSGYVDHVNGMKYDGTLFKRSSDRKAPHNSYITGENMLAGAEKTNATMELSKMPMLSFHDSIESAKLGESAKTMEVRNGIHPTFTSVYVYNEQQGTYGRSVADVVTIDKANDAEVALSNVLVFEAEHKTVDDVGRQAVNLESGGKGLLFQAGVVKEIMWENVDGILTPMENGDAAKLVPGKTWIHMIPTQPGLDTVVSY